jgi:hypothetical protein
MLHCAKRNNGGAMTASVPVQKFAIPCSEFESELLNQSHTSKLLILVSL